MHFDWDFVFLFGGQDFSYSVNEGNDREKLSGSVIGVPLSLANVSWLFPNSGSDNLGNVSL